MMDSDSVPIYDVCGELSMPLTDATAAPATWYTLMRGPTPTNSTTSQDRYFEYYEYSSPN